MRDYVSGPRCQDGVGHCIKCWKEWWCTWMVFFLLHTRKIPSHRSGWTSPRDVPLHELSFTKRTPISTTISLNGWWLWVSCRTWQQRDLNQTYMWQWVSHQHGNKGISNINKKIHDRNYIPRQEQNKIPHQTSNRDIYNTMHLIEKWQRSTWSHYIYLTSWSYLKTRMINYLI